MSRTPRPCLGIARCLWALGLVVFGGQLAWAASAAVWELTPYRVRLVLCVEPAPELTAGLEADLRTGLAQQAALWIGAAWNVTVDRPSLALSDWMLTDLAAVPTEALPQEWLTDDKITLLVLRLTPNGYEVQGRELDVRTRVWGAPVTATAGHAAQLTNTLFAVVRQAFAPLAQVEPVEKERDSMLLRLRASGLPTRDPSCLLTAPGDLFRPLVRTTDREGNLRQVVAIPWTYFAVTEVAPPLLKCQVFSGIRSPMSARPRGRVEQLALAIHPSGGATRVVVRSRTDKNKPLVGYQIYRQLADKKSVAYLGRTDRRGSILIQPSDEPLRMLLIKSGEELLARLPVVPGFEPETIAPVADDDQRLEAEGFITGFQENLVDLVTRREVVQAQIRARIRAKDFPQAQELLKRLRQLKGRDELTSDLKREQQKVFSRDPVVQRKIDKLFDDTQKLLNQYLIPGTLERLAREVSDAQSGKLPPETNGSELKGADTVRETTEATPRPASPALPSSSAAGPG